MGSKGGKGMGKSAGLSATSSLNSELNTAIVSLGAVVLVAGISLFAVRKQRKSKGYTTIGACIYIYIMQVKAVPEVAESAALLA